MGLEGQHTPKNPRLTNQVPLEVSNIVYVKKSDLIDNDQIIVDNYCQTAPISTPHCLSVAPLLRSPPHHL